MVEKNVWRNRLTNILFVILCGALTIIPTAWAIKALTNRTWGGAFDGAWTLIATALLIFGSGYFALFKLRSGPLLLDVGPYPSRVLLLVCSLPIVLGGGLWGGEYSDMAQLLLEQKGLDFLSLLLTYVLLPMFFVRLALSRLQVRQQGISSYGTFIPWQRIYGYGWQDDDTLVLTTRFLGLDQNARYDIPPEKVSALKTHLEAHLGAPTP